MSDLRTDVFLVGKAQPGVELPTLVTNLAKAFKKEPSTIEKMMKRKRSLLKANIEPALAEKYKEIVEKAGGVCELITKSEAAPQVKASEVTVSESRVPESKISEEKASEEKASEEKTESIEKTVPSEKKSRPEKSMPLFVVLPADDVAQEAEETTEADVEQHFCSTCTASIDPAATECPHCFAVQSHAKTTQSPMPGGFALFKDNVIQKITETFAAITSKLKPGKEAKPVKEETLGKEEIVSEENHGAEETSHIITNTTYNDSKIGKFKTPILVFSVFMFVVVTGILVINALPVYEDHAIRKKLNSALPAIANTRNKVAAFIKKTDTFPNNNTLANLPENISSDTIESMKLQDNANLKVTFRIAELHGKNTVIYIPIQKDGEIIWSCKGGTLLDRYRDLECMDVAASQVSSGINLFSRDKRISLKIPASLAENHEIVPSALIGAANLSTEVFVVVLDESKNDFKPDTTLDQYTQKLLANTKEMISESQQIGEIKTLKVNNLPAAQFIVSGFVKGVKLAYVITVIESEKTYYRVLSWTMGDNLEKNKQLLMDISATFVEHN